MYIHKEGYKISLFTAGCSLALIVVMFFTTCHWTIFHSIAASALIIFSLLVLSFFRIPNRKLLYDENKLICPADGTIVAIEEVFEPEFLKEKCKQVSIFMSPANVHVNRYPISGNIIYQKYHKGQYLVASHPKASTDNERTTICIQTKTGERILERQVAGALARRIACYAKEGMEVKQNQELGFIKFGSRVDLYFPLSAKVHVNIGDKVRYGISVIAELA